MGDLHGLEILVVVELVDGKVDRNGTGLMCSMPKRDLEKGLGSRDFQST